MTNYVLSEPRSWVLAWASFILICTSKTSQITVYRLVQNHERFEIPTLVAVEPQPSHPSIRFLAKISPKPSITPFTKGKKRLIASEDANAISLVRVERDESNTERVAVGYE